MYVFQILSYYVIMIQVFNVFLCTQATLLHEGYSSLFTYLCADKKVCPLNVSYDSIQSSNNLSNAYTIMYPIMINMLWSICE